MIMGHLQAKQNYLLFVGRGRSKKRNFLFMKRNYFYHLKFVARKYSDTFIITSITIQTTSQLFKNKSYDCT